jgi:perosamine synthetase
MNLQKKLKIFTLLKKLKKKNFFKTSLHNPKFYTNDKKALVKAIDDGWVSTKGPSIKLFEKKLSKYLNCKYCIATNTGTAGLFIALKSLGIKKKNEVILPNITFVASANAILYCDAVPHLVDTNQNDFNISAEKLQKYLNEIVIFKNGNPFNKKTGNKIFGVMVVHIYGHMCEMDKIKYICKIFKLKVIEDATEALGSKYKNKFISHYSNVAVVSFNGNKIITSGAGGAILTNSKKIANKAYKLVTINNIQGVMHQDHSDLGYNLRMPALNANLVSEQLKKIPKLIKYKRNLFKKYSYFFKVEENEFFDLFSENKNQKSNYWLQVLILKKKYENHLKEIVKIFKNLNISTRTVWKPLSKIRYLKRFPKSNLNNSLKLYKKAICIPSN